MNPGRILYKNGPPSSVWNTKNRDLVSFLIEMLTKATLKVARINIFILTVNQVTTCDVNAVSAVCNVLQ